MSPARNRHKAKAQAASERSEMAGAPQPNSDRENTIRRRAYEIYMERGENPGSELDDWLRAEREVDAHATGSGQETS